MSTSADLHEFAGQSAKIAATTKPLSMALAANTVKVWPGGTVFTTIQSAIDSITDATPQLQYQVSVGPGTYNENVVMKDYVYVIGSGQDVTIITAPGQESVVGGVVNSACGGGISELTINATAGSWGTWPAGIKICGNGNFHISGVTINSGAADAVGNNVRGITNNTGSYTGSVIVGQCILNVNGGDNSTSIGIELVSWEGAGPMTMLVNLTSVSVSSAAQSFGISTSSGATVTAEDSKISAASFALYDSDGASLITANQCTINGPVSSGVVVNN